jgi:hypothetical protein
VERVRDARIGARRLPSAEDLAELGAQRRRVEVADRGELRVVDAEEPGVEGAHALERERVEVGDLLVEGARVEDVPARIGVAVPRHLEGRDGSGFAPLRFDRGDPLRLDLVELGRGEVRGSQRLRHEPHHVGQVFPRRLDRHHRARFGAAVRDAGLEARELVLDLGAGHARSAAVEHRRGH